MQPEETEYEDDYTTNEPYWLCQECGHKDTKAMPKNRIEFYNRVHEKGSPICPKCKSVGFMPVGF